MSSFACNARIAASNVMVVSITNVTSGGMSRAMLTKSDSPRCQDSGVEEYDGQEDVRDGDN